MSDWPRRYARLTGLQQTRRGIRKRLGLAPSLAEESYLSRLGSRRRTMEATRRHFGSIAMAALAASATFNKNVFAQGAKISMKMGRNLSTNHPAMLAMEKACERIKNESNGEIIIQFYN